MEMGGDRRVVDGRVKLLTLERTDLVQVRGTLVLLPFALEGVGEEPGHKFGLAGCEERCGIYIKTVKNTWVYPMRCI